MSKSSLCDYSDAHILVSGIKTIDGTGADDVAKRLDKRENWIIFKNCVLFTVWRSEIKKIPKQIMQQTKVPMYNLIEYSNKYSKTSRSLWQYYRN